MCYLSHWWLWWLTDCFHAFGNCTTIIMSFTAPSTQLQTITIIISARTFEWDREGKKKGRRGVAAHGIMGTKMMMRRAEWCKAKKKDWEKSKKGLESFRERAFPWEKSNNVVIQMKMRILEWNWFWSGSSSYLLLLFFDRLSRQHMMACGNDITWTH